METMFRAAHCQHSLVSGQIRVAEANQLFRLLSPRLSASGSSSCFFSSVSETVKQANQLTSLCIETNIVSPKRYRVLEACIAALPKISPTANIIVCPKVALPCRDGIDVTIGIDRAFDARAHVNVFIFSSELSEFMRQGAQRLSRRPRILWKASANNGQIVLKEHIDRHQEKRERVRVPHPSFCSESVKDS